MTNRPHVAVIVFPGSNDDRDAAWALGSVGAEPALVWHEETELPPDIGAVVLPGGFAYGDYLRTGAIASVAPIMDAVRAFAASGGPVLGICNGFQILCEARLLPGVLRANRQLEFVCRDAALEVESVDSVFMRRCQPSGSGSSSPSSTGRVPGTRTRGRSSSSLPVARSCCATPRM